MYSCADCSCQTQWPNYLQARDAQRVDILHSIIEESAAGSHVQRAADAFQRLSPGARGPVASQVTGGSVKISQTATGDADSACAAANAARHFSGPSSTAAGSSSAAARQLDQSSRQAPGEHRVGSQLPREQEHQAERLLGRAMEDAVEVGPLCRCRAYPALPCGG